MEIIDKFTEEMIAHLKIYPELLEQKQGKDIMQNFFVVSSKERYVSFKEILENLKKKKQKILDDPTVTDFTHNIARRDMGIINDFLIYLGGTGRGLDVPKMRNDAVKYSEFLLRAFALLIRDYEKDIEKYPELEDEIRIKIDATHHVLLDFSILLKVQFPTSTAYLRELKKNIDEAKPSKNKI